MGEVSFHVHKLRVKGHALCALVESTNQLLESGREYSKSNCTYFIIQLCLPFKCQFIGACKDPLMVIVTELSPGVSLRKYLISLRPKILDLYMAINFALDIARAKDCLHATVSYMEI